MLSADELRSLCVAVRAKTAVVDEELVGRVEREVEQYRRRLAEAPAQEPPADLVDRLPLAGWLMYEASLMLLWDVKAGFDSLPGEEAATSLRNAMLIERLADAARALPWPEYAPRGLGTIRAQALVESKRDTVSGYDVAWTLHEEAREKHRSYLDSHGDSAAAKRFVLDLDEMLLQLALAETGTACRTAEQVIGRWLDDWEGADPDAERRAADTWVRRMFRQLSDGAAVGEEALAIGDRIDREHGFVDAVTEKRLIMKAGFRNPAIMTCRALLLMYSFCPEMQRLGMRPPKHDTWAAFMESLLDRFHAAFQFLRRPVRRADGTEVPLLKDHARTIVQFCLHLALLAAEQRLAEPLVVDETLTLDRLDDGGALAMARWLAAPDGAAGDGKVRGDASIIGSASMPRFVQSVEACRNDAHATADYRRWRSEWTVLDRYNAPERWGRIERVLAKESPQKALIIGSDYGGLRGVARDLATMRRTLEGRGFAVRACRPEQATRDGILRAYEELIEDARPGDAVVVYYSGHGGYVEAAGHGPGPAELQYIVPVDYRPEVDGDFRGIAQAELSVLLLRLTDVTRNVTVILDCCHSGRMSRDPSLELRTVPPSRYEQVRAHVERLELPTDRIGESNPHAVRVVACAPEQRAYSYPVAGGEYAGVLTESLALTLEEAGEEPVSWATVLDRVRHRVVGLGYGQRPESEGPADRLLFATQTQDRLHSLPVTALDGTGRVRLDCAPLLRVQHGDEFMIMPAGRDRPDPLHSVGDLTIDEVSAMAAAGPVTFAPGRTAVPIGARAFPTSVTAPQIAVRVPPGADRVLGALETALLARVARDGEEDWAAEVRIEPDGGLTLCDRTGPLHPPYRDDEQGIRHLAAAVKTYAQATQLRRLVGDDTYPLDATEVTVEWGRVVDGTAHPLPRDGAVLRPGERIYVTVHNKSTVPVYVSLLDIGVTGRTSVIYRATPAGRLLPAGRELTLGRRHDQVLVGAGMSWVPGLDPAHARPETILVVLTSAPQSLAALEQPGIAQTRSDRRGDPGSRLRDVIDQLGAGVRREVDGDWSSGLRYEIRGIDFRMHPDGPDAEGDAR
ncbi:caspase family protein [Dactylosporangium sp. CA-139066]|uniref:caspase family protein n=1 Tax=Dactylosporangium sp. CA-139066 TaxID=3239930 RepID=UPI003D8A4D29